MFLPGVAAVFGGVLLCYAAYRDVRDPERLDSWADGPSAPRMGSGGRMLLDGSLAAAGSILLLTGITVLFIL